MLAALTASFRGKEARYHRPVIGGVLVGMLATAITWIVAVRVLNDLSGNVSALALQAGTGLLAIVVLLVVMNWFFHKMYWTGWISLHNRKKQELASYAKHGEKAWRLMLGMGLLGFSSFYREGFEVVLFLQSFRLRVGGEPVLGGVLLGLLATTAVAVLTFLIHHHLPYRRMLVVTGVMLAVVLLVMVGEEAQEMQLAGWLQLRRSPGSGIWSLRGPGLGLTLSNRRDSGFAISGGSVGVWLLINCTTDSRDGTLKGALAIFLWTRRAYGQMDAKSASQLELCESNAKKTLDSSKREVPNSVRKRRGRSMNRTAGKDTRRV